MMNEILIKFCDFIGNSCNRRPRPGLNYFAELLDLILERQFSFHPLTAILSLRPRCRWYLSLILFVWSGFSSHRLRIGAVGRVVFCLVQDRWRNFGFLLEECQGFHRQVSHLCEECDTQLLEFLFFESLVIDDRLLRRCLIGGDFGGDFMSFSLLNLEGVQLRRLIPAQIERWFLSGWISDGKLANPDILLPVVVGCSMFIPPNIFYVKFDYRCFKFE